MKRWSRTQLLIGAVLILSVLTGVITLRKEHLTMDEKSKLEKELADVNMQWDDLKKAGFREIDAADNMAVSDVLKKKSDLETKLKEPVTEPSSSSTSNITTIALIVIGSILAIGIGLWAYQRWSTPVYYGARRR